MIARKQVGWLVAQFYKLLGARLKAVSKAQNEGVIVPIVCHALPAEELDYILGWLKARHINIWLTIDDGWSEVGDYLPILEKYNQKAILFIAPGQTLRGNVWTDEATQLGIEPTEWRKWYSLDENARYKMFFRHAQGGRVVVNKLLDEASVRSIASHPLIEIGNHTWSHMSAPHRPIEEFIEEVERTQKTLEEWTGRCPRYCAYPFGRGTPELDAALRKRNLIPVYTRQGFSTSETLGNARNMVIENVTIDENLARILMAWCKVGETK